MNNATTAALNLQLNNNLNNIGSWAIVPDANIASTITRTDEVNSATTDALDLKLNKCFNNIESTAILDKSHIDREIARTVDYVAKTGGTYTGPITAAGYAKPTQNNITRTTENNGVVTSLEYCQSIGCVVGASPVMSNSQTITGDKVFSDDINYQD